MKDLSVRAAAWHAVQKTLGRAAVALALLAAGGAALAAQPVEHFAGCR